MSEGKKEILLGDCLELMKDIPNGSVDMILCDLPYGTTACKWDTIIPFEPLWKQYERIIKPNGAIVLTATEPFTSYLLLSNINLYKHKRVWIKSKCPNFLQAANQPRKLHEDILVFSKGSYGYQSLIKSTYNPIKENVVNNSINNKGANISKTMKRLAGNMNVVLKSSDDYNDQENYPDDIDFFDNEKIKEHPTQKPIALFEYLIKTYTNENDLVLDNTAGSGTTAIACLKTNRQFIVMEKDPNYFEKIKKRVGDFNKNFEPQNLFGNGM